MCYKKTSPFNINLSSDSFTGRALAANKAKTKVRRCGRVEILSFIHQQNRNLYIYFTYFVVFREIGAVRYTQT
jgi:hypothetical protein